MHAARTSGTLITVKARKAAEPVRSPKNAASPQAEHAKPAYRPGETPLDGRHSVPLLQGAAGNRAVTGLLSGDPAVQRVPVTVPTRRETLFNKAAPGGKATSRTYGDASGAKLDLRRGGTPEAVTVTVRIRFVLPPAAAPLAPKVASFVATAATAPRNTTGLAAGVVATELAPRALGALIDNRYFTALDAVHGTAADVAGSA